MYVTIDTIFFMMSFVAICVREKSFLRNVGLLADIGKQMKEDMHTLKHKNHL